MTAVAVAPRAIVFRRHWSTVRTHTLRIVVEGTIGRPIVNVDGFIVTDSVACGDRQDWRWYPQPDSNR